MTSLKKLFNFFNNQDHVDQLASGVSGVVVAGGVAEVVGLMVGIPPLAATGMAVEIGTIALAMPLLAFAGERFRSKICAVSATVALAGIFGLSTALHMPSANENLEDQATNGELTSIEQAKVAVPSPK